MTFAIPNAADGSPDNAGVGGGGVAYIFTQAMGTNWGGFVLFISASAQFFCATSCMTSASRMTFAFSRDGAIPGSKRWSALTAGRVPANAVMLVGVVAAIVTLPALIKVNIGTADAPLIIPVAFYAVTSIAVIGLYVAFAIPIWLRFRHGDKFEVGSWNNGSKYKWMNPIAVAEIVDRVRLPDDAVRPGGGAVQRRVRVEVRELRADRHHRSRWSALAIWWQVSAKNWFTGPKHTIDEAVLEAFGDDKLTAD